MKNEKFLEWIKKTIASKVPYPCKLEDLEYIEELEKFCSDFLNRRGYHIAKYYEEKRRLEKNAK